MELLPGRTMLDCMLERLREARTLNQIVVAVPDSPANDGVAAEAVRCGATVFRGSETDVLGRYLGAARASSAELIVRVTSDCPLIDPDVLDLHVCRLQARWNEVDFCTNMLRGTYPYGMSCEAMPIRTLARLDQVSDRPEWREHVSGMVYDRPELFRIESVEQEQDMSHLRWAVDHAGDLEFARAAFAALYRPRPSFRMADILAYLAQHPAAAALNGHAGKS